MWEMCIRDSLYIHWVHFLCWGQYRYAVLPLPIIIVDGVCSDSVSYTHLDVYKRQRLYHVAALRQIGFACFHMQPSLLWGLPYYCLLYTSYERYLVYRQQRRHGGQQGRQHGCVC